MFAVFRSCSCMIASLACVFWLATSSADAQQIEMLSDEHQDLRDYYAHVEARGAAEQQAEERLKELLERSADPAFHSFVDMVVLGEAWGRQDSVRFAADALQLLKGERTLHRTHRATPAAAILAAAVRLAGACDDRESLDRLVAAFEKDGGLGKLERQAKEARAHLAPGGETSPATSPAGNKIESATARAYEHGFVQSLRAALAGGDEEAFQTLSAALNEIREVPEARRLALRRTLDRAAELNQTLPPLTPETRELLDDLAAIMPAPHHGREEVRPVELEPDRPGQSSRGLSAHHPFTRKYLKIRTRFINDFLYKGQVAAWYSNQDRSEAFSDQTYHAGFALLTFAGEARVLARSGADPKEAEAIVRQVLHAIENLDGPAVRALTVKPGLSYKTSESGFFVRDWVADPLLHHPTMPVSGLRPDGLVRPGLASPTYPIKPEFQSTFSVSL
ncbi:MAG: hypothetical protein JO344_04515, partial [Planctomycetaceae bacterium]|nr:hypothetical protein [Planctomycetaceae bacterium]